MSDEVVDTELDSESGYSRELEWYLPVGDVICHNEPELARIKTGVVPRELLEDFIRLCDDWEANGFKLYLGGRDVVPNALIINSYIPDILQDKFEVGMACTCCPQSAIPQIGDVRAFFRISDGSKALAYLARYTDIPCAVVGDCPAVDDATEQAIELANKYFTHYWVFKEPKRLVALTEAETIRVMLSAIE